MGKRLDWMIAQGKKKKEKIMNIFVHPPQRSTLGLIRTDAAYIYQFIDCPPPLSVLAAVAQVEPLFLQPIFILSVHR